MKSKREIPPLTHGEAQELLLPLYEDFIKTYIPENRNFLPDHLKDMPAEDLMQKYIFDAQDIFAVGRATLHIQHEHDVGVENIKQSWADLFHMIPRATLPSK